VRLARGRDRPARGRHPWVFSGAVEAISGDPAPGDEVEVRAADGSFVASGLFNPASQIRVRLYDWSPDGRLDASSWRDRVFRAVEHRAALHLLDPAGACRLVFSEGDGLSGLTVDRYGRVLAVQFTSLALWHRRDTLLQALRDALDAHGGVEGAVLRTEKGILEEEGLEVSDQPLFGTIPDAPLEIDEDGLKFGVDLRTGQKTGAYLDQRDNRRFVAPLGAGRDVADVCCYTGGFGLRLLAAGARSVKGVDVSAGALDRARDNAVRNGLAGALDEGRWTLERGDAFKWLEARRDAGDRFGMVVLDPPRFARSTRGVPQALRGYSSLNELAVQCLEPGGVLVTCSCTGRVGREQFMAVLAGVEERTGRRIRIIASRGQPPDHPVSPTCPETAYLKCLVCRVDP
jgi:23S rRNA (cytosine1962-C5)-methyltransferase